MCLIELFIKLFDWKQNSKKGEGKAKKEAKKEKLGKGRRRQKKDEKLRERAK